MFNVQNLSLESTIISVLNPTLIYLCGCQSILSVISCCSGTVYNVSWWHQWNIFVFKLYIIKWPQSSPFNTALKGGYDDFHQQYASCLPFHHATQIFSVLWFNTCLIFYKCQYHDSVPLTPAMIIVFWLNKTYVWIYLIWNVMNALSAIWFPLRPFQHEKTNISNVYIHQNIYERTTLLHYPVQVKYPCDQLQGHKLSTVYLEQMYWYGCAYRQISRCYCF